ncbi:MAG: hypothetical protein WB511_11330 [Nitrososphaeraceae archaeon]
MICKQTQNTMDTLLRFKIDDSNDNAIDQNKIASIMEKPNCERTKEENETLVLYYR